MAQRAFWSTVPLSRQEPVMFSRLIPHEVLARETSTAVSAHPSATGAIVLVALVLAVLIYLAIQHWKMTLAIAVVCPILLIIYGGSKIMAAVGRA